MSFHVILKIQIFWRHTYPQKQTCTITCQNDDGNLRWVRLPNGKWKNIVKCTHRWNDRYPAYLPFKCVMSITKRLILKYRSTLEPHPCRGKTRCHACPNGVSGKCHLKHVVSNISCKRCKNDQMLYFYLGETSRPIREWFKKHLSDARLRRLGTGLGQHVLDKHTELSDREIIVFFFIEIITRNRDVAGNKIHESIQSRENNQNLNTFSNSWPII